MLRPYRVLDLTDSRAELGPMILGDLGADVIKVEPPGGSLSRWSLPLDSTSLREPTSLRFQAFNRNKRSLILDLDTGGGRGAFHDLVASADFLVENAGPGAMAARGLGFEQLRAVNPELVYVAIAPFGQDGPYAEHLATDLTLAAMGGMIAVNGDPDRPPVRVSIPQAWLHAAAESAVAAMVAHERRLQTGEAQFVDVSVQAAVFWTGLNSMIASAVQGRDIERNGTVVPLGTINLRVLYPCADGFVLLTPTGGTLPVLVPWMVEDGVVPAEWLDDEDWATYDRRLLGQQSLNHGYEELLAAIETYTRRHSKGELLRRGMPRGVFFAPVNNVADVLAFEQLNERGYWRSLELANGRRLRAPGSWVRLGARPMTVRLPPPAPGEHTDAVLRDLPARQKTRKTASARTSGRSPFEGIKVADFSWVGVGPITARYLADHGATTVHVESSTRPDILRLAGPFKDGILGPNRSQYFGGFNTSKLSIALDLKQPLGKQVARRLIGWADVLLESFTPGTMANLGLDYEAARNLNPGIIMVSTCLMGQSGPAASLAGYGLHAAGVSGFVEITGWPDRPPSGPFSAYTDTIANRFLAVSIMAALDHRRRTGEGQYIEQAQMESALHFLAPEILDYQVSGRIPARTGNDSPADAPHNVYPCAGDDEWCAIAVETDAQWRALRAALGEPVWAADPILETVSGRLAHRELLDAGIAEWTRRMSPHAAMERLQAAGVPAGAVQRSSDLLADTQLAHRRFYHPMQHPEMGEVPYEGHQFQIRGYESGPRSPAPCLGEHSLAVMRDILGMTDDEIAEVAASGALV